MSIFPRHDVLHSLLSGIPAFLFVLRQEGLGLLSVSEGVKDLSGFEARDLIASPGLFASRLLPDDREKMGRLSADLPEGVMQVMEFRFLCANGRTRWFRSRIAKGHGPPGDPDAITGIAMDIEEERTSRRTAQERSSILHSASAVIFFSDPEGIIRMWNDASELFFGWTRREMIGTSIHRLFSIPPEAVDALVRTVRSGRAVSQETRLITKSGEEIDCRVTAACVAGEGGVPAGMVVTVLGTGERKGLERQLQEVITRLRTIERVNRAIAKDWDIGKLHPRISGELGKLIEFDRVSVAIFEEGGDPSRIRIYPGDPAGTGFHLPLDRSAPGWVLTHRMARADGDIGASPERFSEDGDLLREGMRSRLILPLFAGERVVGTLCFHSRRTGAYSLMNVEKLGSIPDQMATAIEKHGMVTRLRASEEKYRLLFEHGPPASTVGTEGNFLDVNVGLLRLFGYGREELLRLSVSDLSASAEPDFHHESVLRTGRPVEEEVLQKRKDGTNFFGWLKAFPVSADLVLRQITDVTQKKDAEEALRREKEFSSRILAVANILIAVLDREGKIVFFNRKCEEVTGWREEEVRGKAIWDLLLPDRVVIPVRETFFRLDETEITPFHECPWRTRDGRERNIRWNNSLTRDERGEVVWVIWTGVDVTEQMQLEEQLRHIQKMDAVGTLAGGIAHDFNNIIQAIVGYTSVLKSRIGETGLWAEEIDAIERAGLRASELTMQLLGFARGGKYEVRPIDFNQVVRKVVSMIRHTFDRSIEIHTDLADGLATVEGDAGQLEQTVLNLCINARDAMPGGGILTLRTRNESVSGETEGSPAGAPPGSYASLLLSDTGIGIPPENIPRIFEPFFTTKEPGKGSGMGLAMAYGIVKNHGGFLDVTSDAGTETTFRVLLPASSKGLPSPEDPAPDLPAARGTETILFVDDEEALRLLAVEMLGRLGYRILTAGNGFEAVTIYAENRDEIAVVILDMIMPGMGGEETFYRLKEIDPSVRILLSSGYAMEGRPHGLLMAGAAGFLQKPYRVGTLASSLRRIIEGGTAP